MSCCNYRFGDQANITISLNQYTNVDSLVSAINNLNFNTLQAGSGHNIQAALNVMRTQAFTSQVSDIYCANDAMKVYKRKHVWSVVKRLSQSRCFSQHVNKTNFPRAVATKTALKSMTWYTAH